MIINTLIPAIRRGSQILIGSMLTLLLSITLAAPAYAADAPTDLVVTVQSSMENQAIVIAVCNSGPSDVKSFTLAMTHVNFTPQDTTLLPNGFDGVTATNAGTFNAPTSVWNGLMEPSQCVLIGIIGQITGSLGQNISHHVDLTSSVLGDDTVNIDPNLSNNSVDLGSLVITNVPEIAVSTRLLTTGTITSGSTVSYEVTLSNIGSGDYTPSLNGLPFGVYFVMPVGSALDNVTDNNLSDDYTINGCAQVGDTSAIGPGLGLYPGVVAGCQLNVPVSFPAGATTSLIVSFDVDSDFQTGNTSVYGIAVSNTPKMLKLQIDSMVGNDPFDVPSSIWTKLTYDSGELHPIVGLCSGQSETTTDGTGCFTLTFNKVIYEDDFNISQLQLLGGGTISGLVKTGSNKWEVHVAAIPVGATSTLVLKSDADIRDYSAVKSSVNVLGSNTIRYIGPQGNPASNASQPNVPSHITASSSPIKGQLANTGSTNYLGTPILLMCFGVLLCMSTKFKHKSWV